MERARKIFCCSTRKVLQIKKYYILRHASLTEFYDSCKDLLVTAKVAGHGSIKSTARYAKARDERVTQTQIQMDKKLSSLI